MQSSAVAEGRFDKRLKRLFGRRCGDYGSSIALQHGCEKFQNVGVVLHAELRPVLPQE
jgi:hypothetical protein